MNVYFKSKKNVYHSFSKTNEVHVIVLFKGILYGQIKMKALLKKYKAIRNAVIYFC